MHSVLTTVAVASLAAGALGLFGCAADKNTSASAAASAAAVNATCACGAPVDGTTVTSYNGKTIGFCGQECLAEFNTGTDAQKKDAVAKMTKADHPKADHPKTDHPKADHPKADHPK